MAEQNNAMPNPEAQMGKRHDKEPSKKPQFRKEAHRLGFSSQEIEALMRLYNRALIRDLEE